MQVFIQDEGESLLIDRNIGLTIIEIFGDNVVLAIDAPDWVEIGGCEQNRAEDEWEDWISSRPR